MRKLSATLLAATLLAASLPAVAGPHDYRRDWRPDHYRPMPVERHHHRDRLVWGIAGLTLGAIALSAVAAHQAPPPVAPVVVAPAVAMPPAPPERLWYYCDSYRAYYPNVPSCPEPWRAIPAY